jgi:hypothetical protein
MFHPPENGERIPASGTAENSGTIWLDFAGRVKSQPSHEKPWIRILGP